MKGIGLCSGFKSCRVLALTLGPGEACGSKPQEVTTQLQQRFRFRGQGFVKVIPFFANSFTKPDQDCKSPQEDVTLPYTLNSTHNARLHQGWLFVSFLRLLHRRIQGVEFRPWIEAPVLEGSLNQCPSFVNELFRWICRVSQWLQGFAGLKSVRHPHQAVFSQISTLTRGVSVTNGYDSLCHAVPTTVTGTSS